MCIVSRAAGGDPESPGEAPGALLYRQREARGMVWNHRRGLLLLRVLLPRAASVCADPVRLFNGCCPRACCPVACCFRACCSRWRRVCVSLQNKRGFFLRLVLLPLVQDKWGFLLRLAVPTVLFVNFTSPPPDHPWNNPCKADCADRSGPTWARNEKRFWIAMLGTNQQPTSGRANDSSRSLVIRRSCKRGWTPTGRP
jgi:hypothetical protein